MAPPRSLPPGLLIQTGQWVWRSLWLVMMGQMAPRDRNGAYQRPPSQFRHSLGDAQGNYPAEPGRYRLLVGWGCPWAHRTLVMRVLKGLESTIAVTPVVPRPEAGGWAFVEPFQDCTTLPQAYQKAQPGYSGRCTVPVLWDDRRQEIVNNESAEILVMLNDRCNDFAAHPQADFYPPDLRPAIDTWNEKIYHRVNNGVYRCGFAQTQAAYDRAVEELFSQLDDLDRHLQTQRYLLGDRLTLADIRLFPTLFRFDLVYHSLFKCSRQRIQDYPALGPYLRDLYQLPGIAATCHPQQIQQDYFGNLFPLNPGGILPALPRCPDLTQPHHRDTLSP